MAIFEKSLTLFLSIIGKVSSVGHKSSQTPGTGDEQ